MKVSKWSFKIEDKVADDAFKMYLRQSVQHRIKFIAALNVLFIIIQSASGEFTAAISFNVCYVLISLIAWWVTARHLWTVDYFSLLVALLQSVGITYNHF
jgi:hypothetical protein